MLSFAPLLQELTDLVDQAGALVMQVYASDFAVQHKADASPVTQADTLAEAHIVAGLKRLAPHIPIVAEEAMAAGAAPLLGRQFWLVDPLDGTREFLDRNGQFTVNIALIEEGEAVLGVVGAPAVGELYSAARDLGAWVRDAQGQRRIACRLAPAQGLTVLSSRAHGDEPALQRYIARLRVAEVRRAGSSLKLCHIAAGLGDLYPRFGRTMEWDIAAGHAVLAAAGGQVRHADDAQVLRYGKPGFENPDFIARGLTT